MNIETKIDIRLWNSIKNSFDNRNYTGAILDSLYFLSSLIREKTSLESDGVSLIGQAFGGKSPKLKVNRLQTESDWNIQSGIEQILRGIYQAIRNPRSHEKYTDSENDAISIIMFINYLICIIDQSKSPFSKSSFIKRVFDPFFVANKRYADLIVEEIPQKQRLEMFIEIYRQKETGDGSKLKYFFEALFNSLNDDEKKCVYEIISDELKQIDNEDTIRITLQIIPQGSWLSIEEIARLRIENKLITSIKNGRYNQTYKKCEDGSLGTWATNILSSFTMKNELMFILFNKLESDNKKSQNYVFNYFIFDLLMMPILNDRLKQILNDGLIKGDVRYLKNIELLLLVEKPEWYEHIHEAYSNFCEKEQDGFDPFDDDDVPF